MKKNRCLLIAAGLLALQACEGPQGPPGAGFGSLDDPGLMPAVVYTYPEMNSSGPYPDFYFSYCEFEYCSFYSMIQIRFNKFMDVTSVRRAVSLTSTFGDIRTDTNDVVALGGDVVMVTPNDTNGSRYNVRYRVGEVYTLRIDSTARDVNGNHLTTPFTSTFVPEPYFRVTGISPDDGASGVNTALTARLSFNGEIDSSIFPFIRVEPPVAFQPQFSWRPNELYLSFNSFLSNGTTYTVSVDSGAPDAAGHPLGSGFSASFTTAGFGISNYYPPDGGSGVSLTSRLEIAFSSRIDTASFRRAFSILPPIDGRLRLNTYGAYATFEPGGGWDELTTYTATVDTNLSSESGTKLDASFTWGFTTARFQISWSSPYNGSFSVTRYPYIEIHTNGPVDSLSIPGSVRLDPPVPLNAWRRGGETSFTLVPGELLAPSTTYTLTVDTTLRTVRGARLSEPYTTSFTTAPLE